MARMMRLPLCALLLLSAWPLLTRCEEQAPENDDRLLLSVRKPMVTNTTTSTVNIGFYTGPNLRTFDFAVKCAPVNSSCSDPVAGNITTGVLPNAVSFVETQVNGLEDNTTYWCYVTSSTAKVTKCEGPLEAVTLTAV